MTAAFTRLIRWWRRRGCLHAWRPDPPGWSCIHCDTPAAPGEIHGVSYRHKDGGDR